MGDMTRDDDPAQIGFDPILKRVVTLEESWEMPDAPDVLRVKQMFHRHVLDALHAAGLDPLELYESHPDATFLVMAQRLKGGANAFGMKSAIYTEARKTGRLREVAKEMLRREIVADYPDGWEPEEVRGVHPAMRIKWYSDLGYVFHDAWIGRVARQIDGDLISKNPPPTGWKPDDPDFPYLDILFDKYWPEDLERQHPILPPSAK